MSETFVGPASTRSFSVVIFAGSLTDNEPPVRFADKDSGFGRPPRKDEACLCGNIWLIITFLWCTGAGFSGN